VFWLKRRIHFVSPFTLEEAVSRIRERDEQKRSDLPTFFSKMKGIRFEISEVDSANVNFMQFKQGLSTYSSFNGLKLGGIVLRGTMKQREDGKTDITAISTIILGQCIASSASLLILLGTLSTVLPCVFIALGYHLLAVLLIGVLLWLSSAYIWSALLKKIMNDLFNVLKWTLHGLSVEYPNAV
jgi:hypothetical protein